MKRVMLRTFLCASPLMLLFGLGVYSAERRPGNEIRIYTNDFEEMLPIIARVNRRLAPEGLIVTVTDTAASADVQVMLVDGIAGAPNTAGVARAYEGQIEIVRRKYADGNTLIHELLHCAGVSHEPDDPSSVMYPASMAWQQLKPHHVEALRRLAGITAFERIVAQCRLLLF
jgi:hypothetical protein